MTKLVLRNSHVVDRAVQILRSLSHEPPMEVVIRPHKSKRTLSQNALYWKWLDIIRLHIADSIGQIYSGEDLHEWFKAKFLPTRLIGINGEDMPITSSTTKLNTAEMSEYMECIDHFCVTQLHLFLPQPGMPDGDHN